MKQLTIISGKGGTGKTTITANFASLAKTAVVADCDVDAPDLHLILKPKIMEVMRFSGAKIAVVDYDKCSECGRCIEHCRFDAISEGYEILENRCEGCGACEYVCPFGAIRLINRESGMAYKSFMRFGPMAHALLNTAQEASGKLVALVRNNAKELAKEYEKELCIIDGPPGIGCPVIAAIAGVNLVLAVTEPTLPAIHDLERILGVAHHFNIPAVVCINKCDINWENSKKIEEYCRKGGVDVVGKLPYDDVTTEAMIAEKTVVEFSDSEIARNIIMMWLDIERRLL